MQNLNKINIYSTIADRNLILGIHVHIMKLHILSGDRSRSRSSFKVKGKKKSTIVDRNLILSMYLYLMELYILSGDMSRSRSSFKVNFNLNSNLNKININSTIADTNLILYMHVYMELHFRVMTDKGQGHPSRSKVNNSTIADMSLI